MILSISQRIGLIALLIVAAIACQPSTAAPTSDIPATVAAQVRIEVASQVAAAPSPTPMPLPTYTLYPTATAYPTYTPYPTATPAPVQEVVKEVPVKVVVEKEVEVPAEKVYPTPALAEAHAVPLQDSDGLYDLGFGQLMFLKVPNLDTAGLFSPRPARNIFVYPPGPEWEDNEGWSVTYVQLKCGEFQEGEKNDSGHQCVIVE